MTTDLMPAAFIGHGTPGLRWPTRLPRVAGAVRGLDVTVNAGIPTDTHPSEVLVESV